jgi:protein required for attachment to host cells
MPKLDNSAQQALDESHQGEERRQEAKDRRKADKDRRDLDRLADEIAPRRHPDIRGRREKDSS